MVAEEVEIAVMGLLGVRQNIIVPNVSWGLGLHECDLLMVTKAGYAVEVEIKVSKYDLLADKKKSHGHNSNRIRRLYFAVPGSLMDHVSEIPDRAGVIAVSWLSKTAFPTATMVRPAKVNPDAQRLNPDEILKVAHLGCMRLVGLKRDVLRLTRIIDGSKT